uniref:Ammonium transporter AmtB-like domain-containing protein n=2 Tax=Emiliania huxleyi TaxID=2903 RepID=A0A0D3K9K9_EMIH1
METENSIERAIAAAERDAAESNRASTAAAQRVEQRAQQRTLFALPGAHILAPPQRASKSQRPVYASESKSQWVTFVAQLPHILVAAAIGVAAVLERLCSTVPVAPSAGVLDSADTSWMLVSTMGVLLMVPALGLFEAGLLRAKNSVSVLIQCFAGVAVLTVLWFVIGFSLCFSQGMFAAITPLLCTGAFAERLRFEAFLGFIVGWRAHIRAPLSVTLGLQHTAATIPAGRSSSTTRSAT